METIRKRSRIFTICAVLVAMFCLAVGAGNTVSFERMMNQVVERYVSENNQQVASQISYRLKMGREFVSDFADTLSRMPNSSHRGFYIQKDSRRGVGRTYGSF